ncbi:unnamed protein product [Periconia digitata]|uniref:histidine kinase n=1 Tax=Periconia digitata TaxID=1303443 RepID=A0A9W4UCA8_9PLEO|nr:unnamed protein product [Periconia digitata]
MADRNCEIPSRTWEHRKAVRGESRREQQFYQYYGPFQRMTDYGPTFCDVRVAESREKHKAVTCPDKILTAFCQLGALRMNARRCLIFFFDVNHAYIMAEATKTLSLENDATHEPGDELWMGHSVIPRDVACCETTVNLPSFPTPTAADGDMNKSVFIVKDLTKHPDLSTRPYVTEYPNGRFYAGVPITTPSGVNIGAYCILDDKVRDGVSKEDLVFLGDMSQTVMNHLETVRDLFERQQSNRMVAGLGDFVRPALKSDRKAPPATNMLLNENGMGNRVSQSSQFLLPDSLIDRKKTPTSVLPERIGNDYLTTPNPLDGQAGLPQTSIVGSSLETPPKDFFKTVSANDWDNKFLNRQMRTDTWDAPESMAFQMEEDHTTRPPPRSEGDANNVNSTFQRAAENLCQSLDVDGVVFLDASVQVFGGLAKAQDVESTEGSTADSDDSVDSHSHSDSATDKSHYEYARTCRVLGCAQMLQEGRSDRGLPKDRPPQKLTESFLRQLMRRNPNGRIWTFDENLKIHMEDGSSSDDSGGNETVIEVSTPRTQKRRTIGRDQRSDGEILQSAFPGSRCIALHGIWDHMRKRWSVAGLYWTFDPLRHIRESEMHFVAAFCDVVVAETKRLEVLGSDKAKSDFISSISHELRSPLHGILGSCEMLSEYGLDNTASTLVEQIDACGHTLLEIIDHLLDLAEVKSQRLTKGAVRSSRIGQHLQPTGNSPVEGTQALNASIALDDLTEDAVVSSVYSFYYNQGADERSSTPVILDIDRSTGESWGCSLASGGWKRICINLVTNALKYTPSGFIRVSLKQKSKPGPRRRFDAVLTVLDSGKGMSKEFQSNHLFHDFSQEDTLSNGLGLGMHMVSRMVHAMGGEIEVTSDQNGTGTRVTVRVPLENHQISQNRSDSEEIAVQKVFEGLTVGIVKGTSSSPVNREDFLKSTASAMAVTSIENNIKFLGASLEHFEWESSSSHDLNIVMEAGLAECLSAIENSRTANEKVATKGSHHPPILVICRNSRSAQILRDIWMMNDLRFHVTMEHIHLPCGIRQITRAIFSVLRLHKKRTTIGPAISALRKNDSSRERSVAPHNIEAHSRSQSKLSTTPSVTKRLVLNQKEADPVPSLIHDTYISSNEQRRSLSKPDLISQGRTSTYPLAHSDAEPPHGQTKDAHPSPTIPTIHTNTSRSKRPTLLLVDDNDINLRLLTAFAKNHEYPYMTALNGQLAVNSFENAHRNHISQSNSEDGNGKNAGMGIPSVILMDINMPVMDGYEAVQRIRAYEKKNRLKASKIIAVTALQSEAAHVEAFGSGFDMFLSKPLKLKDLARLIDVT